MNFNSKDIRIYPAANRSKDFDYGSDLNLEQNIVSQITNITDYDSFIINGLDLIYNKTSKSYYIKSGSAVIKGYLIKIGDSTVESIGITIPSLDKLINNQKYNIYLRLKTSTKVVNNTNIIQVNGYDEFQYGYGYYTGFEVIATTDDLLGDFKIATISKDGTVEGISKGKKFKASNTSIEIDPSTGLVSESYKGSFGNWLENRFIIDDGIIS